MKVYGQEIARLKQHIAQHKLELKLDVQTSESRKDILKLIELYTQQAKIDKSESYVFVYLHSLYTLAKRFER